MNLFSIKISLNHYPVPDDGDTCDMWTYLDLHEPKDSCPAQCLGLCFVWFDWRVDPVDRSIYSKNNEYILIYAPLSPAEWWNHLLWQMLQTIGAMFDDAQQRPKLWVKFNVSDGHQLAGVHLD